MNEIGRKTIVGIGKETTFGTKASSIEYFPVESFDPAPRTTAIQEDGIFGRKENRLRGTCIDEAWAEPQLEGNVYDDAFGQFLMGIFGTDTISGAAVPYTHDFELNQGDAPSFTIVWKDGNMTKMLTGAVISSAEISQERGKFLVHKTGFLSKFPETTVETPGITAENKFCSKFASVKVATDLAGLGAASAIGAESFRLTINKEAEALYVFGANSPSDNYDQSFDVTGEFMLSMDAGTYLDLFEAGTEQALQLEVINTDVTIGTGNPEVRFQLPAVLISDWGRNGGKDERVTQTCGFSASYDLIEGTTLDARLLNSNAVAY